ncbi:MAG: hypothetical protein PHO56_04125 [Patescibacteria group bacterium]|nr:hypothetical protein [Patescibacteria group bacterium]
MPFLLIVLCSLIAWPLAAAENPACPQCDTLISRTDTVIMPSGGGDWYSYRQISSAETCQVNSHLIQGIRKDFEALDKVSVETGITAEQATRALRQPIILTSITADSARVYGGFLWLEKKIQTTYSGIIYHDDPPGKKVIRAKKYFDSSPRLAINILLCLSALLLIAFFCAISIPAYARVRKSVGLIIGGGIVGIMLVVIGAETIQYYHQSLFWAFILGIHLTLALLFLLAIRYLLGGQIKDRVVLIGIFTLIELILYVGLQTKSYAATLVYLALAFLPFLIIDLLPVLISKRRAKKKKPKIPMVE